MKVKLTPISQAVFIALLGTSGAVLAQQSQPDQQLETVTVTGVRASQEKSLGIKRNADAHIDVISAEDIGKMPGKNVADSLSRVPGVVVTNTAAAGAGGFDERDRVGLRGTNPSLTQTLVDGHSIASGDWFVLDQTGAGVGRSVSYSLLPSELVSRVEVRKSSEASLVEGGTAGSVNIFTRRPLDFAKPLTGEVALGAVYADLPKKTDPQLSALFNFRNEEKTLGVMVQVFSEKRSLRRDGIEVLGYNQLLSPGTTPALVAARPELNGVYTPDVIGAALFTQERERKGGLIRAQIKPSASLDIALTGFSSKMDADNYNRNYLFAAREGQLNGATLSNYDIATDGQGRRTLTRGTFNFATPSTAGFYDMIGRKSSAETGFVAADATFKATDELRFTVNAGRSSGKGKTLQQNVAGVAINAMASSFALNGTGTAPSFSFTNPTNQADWIFGYQGVVVNDEENWGQIDGQFDIDAGALKALKFGARGAKHERATGPIVAQGPRPGGGFQTLPAFNGRYPGNFGNGLGGSFPTNIAFINPGDLAAYNTAFANRDPVIRREASTEYAVKESTTAGYLQGDFEGTGWSGNAGVRVVRTKQQSSSYRATLAGQTPTITGSAFGDFSVNQDERSYTDVLPSANLRLDLRSDLVARLAVSRTMTRADYTALSGFTAPNTNGLFLDNNVVGGGSSGNPALKPVRSNNVDANVEWYFAPRSFVSAGAFYMDLGSYVTDGTIRTTLPVLLTNTNQTSAAPQLVNREFLLTGPVNKKAKVRGVEFAFETPISANFGVTGNYTYADGKDADGDVLRGNVRNSFSLGGFFENDRFSARLNYTYADDIFVGSDRGTKYFQKGTGVVSASLGYKINDTFAVSLDGQNLNDPKLKYYASETQPRGIYKNGRQYYLTARAKF